MAYVINPDGTISVIPVHYDSAGNMKLSGLRPDGPEELVTVPKENVTFPQPKKFKKHKKQKLNAEVKNKPRDVISSKPYVPTEYKHAEHIESSPKPLEPVPYFISRIEIDKFIRSRRARRLPIKQLEFEGILMTLKGNIKKYFVDKCKEYVLFCEENNIRTIIRPVPKKKKKKNKAKSLQNTSPNSIASRAVIRGTGKKTETRDFVFGRSVNGASRQPKYGYARDYFGRIQERDRYDEDRHNEFEQSRRSQRNYDYSGFDPNDDNEGGYEGWK